MDIDKDKIGQIIEELSNPSEDVMRAVNKLKALIEPEKWKPKKYSPNFSIRDNGDIDRFNNTCKEDRLYGCEFETKELATIARDMNKRNQLILQAKHEIGAEDGEYKITYKCPIEGWGIGGAIWRDNPELTFKAIAQADLVIKMLQLNANPS